MTMSLLLVIFATLIQGNIAIAEGVRIERITFTARSLVRSPLAARLYHAADPVALVIYLHGGGCTGQSYIAERIAIRNPELEQPFIQSLLQQNLSVLIPEYALSAPVNLDTYPNVNLPEQRKAWVVEKDRQDKLYESNECAQFARNNLTDLRGMIPELAKVSDLPRFILGHSYGGYLVNLMATQSVPNVAGYISYAGVWDSKSNDPTLVPKGMNPLASKAAELAPILVIQSKDDQNVPYTEFKKFSAWAKGIPNAEAF